MVLRAALIIVTLGTAVAAQAPAPGWAGTLAMVEAAAFHLYARGAADYEP
jgi:hypothetical protein